MLLYNIFETISIASGMKEGLDDYSKGMSIFDAFIGFLDGLTYDPFEEFTIYGTDGTVMTREEFDALWEAAVGNGKLKAKPTEQEFAKFRVLSGGKTDPEQSPEPSESPNPDNTPIPILKNRMLRSFSLGSGALLQKTASDFLKDVQDNAVPEVDPNDYYSNSTTKMFTGYPAESNAGDFFINLSYKYRYDNSPTSTSYTFSGSAENYYYFLAGNGTDSASAYCIMLYAYDINRNTYFRVYKSDPSLSGTENAFFLGSWFPYPYTNEYYSNYKIEANLPVFSSSVYFEEYCKNGNASGLLFIPTFIPYDYHSMTASAPDTLDQLTGAQVSADKLPDLNNSMREAANSVEPGTDKDENNAALIAAVKAAVAEALPEVQPDPDPQPSTVPDPSPTAAPDPDAGTGTYSGILGLILSAIQAIASQIWGFFANPFSIITNGITSIVELLPKVNELVQALPASIFGFFQVPLDLITSGITNLYNGVLRIIELLPEQVQLVLGNIVSLPSAMLQAFADPLGAIQTLLGALPSWTNIQGYLDKILDALLDPGSVLQPSGPGGEDPGGDGSGGGSGFNLLSLLNGLIYLILILILLLKIFIHCLQFIINIFKIEASPGFLPDEMVMGLNFLKQIEITGIGLSIYDFMMGLVYILMVFGVVKLLRGYAYKIHIPSGGGK